MDSEFKKQSTAYEHWLASLFIKAPHLPAHVRDTLVTIAPWFALIAGVIGLFATVPALFSTLFVASLPFAPFMVHAMFPGLVVSFVVLAVSSVLDLLAFKPLSLRKKHGWNLIFYAVTLSLIATLLTTILGGGAVSGILGALIAYWFLFEVRDLYKA